MIIMTTKHNLTKIRQNEDLDGNFLNRSILDDSLADELQKFDVGIAIGSLHHTGDLEHAIENLEKLIRPHGRLLVMVYNAFGLRRMVTRPHVAARQMVSYIFSSQSSWPESDPVTRGKSDTNSLGIPAPVTTYATKRVFKSRHHHVNYKIQRENFHRIPLPKKMGGQISRSTLLGLPAHIMGPDLYAEGIVQETTT
jgi:SAM-dependent methyltransferase